jgi:hypothetical protein
MNLQKERYFCTYLDENYLPQGLALVRSIGDHHADFVVFICTMSRKAENVLQKLQIKNVIVVPLRKVEEYNPILKKKKKERTKIEYYFTCTPILIHYLIMAYSIPYIEYIDADMFFFQSSNRIFEKTLKYSIAITPHRFARTKEIHQKYGTYNVGWMFFRADTEGLRCLKWWGKKCLEWCFDRIDGDKYADQKYLNRFQRLFTNVGIINTPGFNEAPWNICPEKISFSNGRVLIGKNLLVLFHFSGLQKVIWRVFDPKWSDYLITPNQVLIRKIYKPYLCLVSFWCNILAGKIKGNSELRKINSFTILKHSKSLLSLINEVRKKIQKQHYLVAFSLSFIYPSVLRRQVMRFKGRPVFMPRSQSKSRHTSFKSENP